MTTEIRDPHSPLGLDSYLIFSAKSGEGRVWLASDHGRQPTIFSQGAPFAGQEPFVLYGDELCNRPILEIAPPQAGEDGWKFTVGLPGGGRILGFVVCGGGKKCRRKMALNTPGGRLRFSMDRAGILGGQRVFFDVKGRAMARLAKGGGMKRGLNLSLAPTAKVSDRPLLIAAAFIYAFIKTVPPARGAPPEGAAAAVARSSKQ